MDRRSTSLSPTHPIARLGLNGWKISSAGIITKEWHTAVVGEPWCRALVIKKRIDLGRGYSMYMKRPFHCKFADVYIRGGSSKESIQNTRI